MLLAALAWIGALHGGLALEPVAPHPNSIGEVDVRVRGDVAEIELRSQSLTLLESAALDLDADRDGRLTREEVVAAWPEIRDHYAARVRLTLDGVDQRLDFAEFEALEDRGSGSPGFAWLVLRARVPLDREPATLGIDYQLFFEDGNPGHAVLVRVRGLSVEAFEYMLGASRRQVQFEAEPPLQRMLTFAGVAWDHVFRDLLFPALVVALLLGLESLGAVAVAVLLFTAGHLASLHAATLPADALPAGSGDLLEALSPGVMPLLPALAYALVWWNLLRGPGGWRGLLPAVALGLFAGCARDAALAPTGLPEDMRGLGLLSYHPGLLLALLLVAMPLHLLGRLALRLRGGPEQQEERRVLAAGVTAAVLLGVLLEHEGGLRRWIQALLDLDAQPLGDRAAPWILAVGLTAAAAAVLCVRRTPGGTRMAWPPLLSLLLVGLFRAGTALARISGL